MGLQFTINDDGKSIEEYLEETKSSWKTSWRNFVNCYLKDDANLWLNSLNYDKMMTLSDDEFEQVFLDKWSHAKKKDIEIHKGLFSCDNILLQVHGCIQKEKVIVFVNPSCKHNFINVNLTKRLQVPEKHIQGTKVEGENVQVFKDLKVTMDKYVLHSNFFAIDMDDVDVVLGYPWMDSIGTVNINVQKKFLKLWYNKKKITFQDISRSEQEEPKVAHEEVSTGKLVVAPTDTSNEESIFESKEKPTEAHDEMPHEGHENEEYPIEELEEIPQEEYRNEEDPIEAHEEMPQEEHQNEE